MRASRWIVIGLVVVGCGGGSKLNGSADAGRPDAVPTSVDAARPIVDAAVPIVDATIVDVAVTIDAVPPIDATPPVDAPLDAAYPRLVVQGLTSTQVQAYGASGTCTSGTDACFLVAPGTTVQLHPTLPAGERVAWTSCVVTSGDCSVTVTGDQSVSGAIEGGAVIWSATFGLGTSSNAFVTDLTTDAAGNVYAIGQWSGTNVDFGDGVKRTAAGSLDVFVVSFSSSGLLRWVRTVGSSIQDSAGGLAVDETNHLLLVAGAVRATTTTPVDFGGGFQSTRATTNGVNGYLWSLATSDGTTSNLFSFGDDQAYSQDEFLGGVTIGPDGAAYVTGTFEGPVAFGPYALGDSNPNLGGPLVARFDGGVTWVSSWDASGGATFTHLAVVGTEIVAAGWFNGDIAAFSLTASGNGNDILVAGLATSNGAEDWAKSLSGSGLYQDVLTLRVDSAGTVYLPVVGATSLSVGGTTYTGNGVIVPVASDGTFGTAAAVTGARLNGFALSPTAVFVSTDSGTFDRYPSLTGTAEWASDPLDSAYPHLDTDANGDVLAGGFSTALGPSPEAYVAVVGGAP